MNVKVQPKTPIAIRSSGVPELARETLTFEGASPKNSWGTGRFTCWIQRTAIEDHILDTRQIGWINCAIAGRGSSHADRTYLVNPAWHPSRVGPILPKVNISELRCWGAAIVGFDSESASRPQEVASCLCQVFEEGGNIDENAGLVQDCAAGGRFSPAGRNFGAGRAVQTGETVAPRNSGAPPGL
jgi:hypothetical protein